VVPGILVALGPWEVPPYVGIGVFGLAIWCAATLLGWAAETSEKDITGSLAMALLAIVAILPEYAVDVLLAYKAGSNPAYEPLASANMNGATRLLIGLALPLVVLVGVATRRRRAKRAGEEVRRFALFDVLPITPAHRGTMWFLLVGALIALTVPLTGQIHVGLGGVLLIVFAVFLWHTGRGEVEEPDLVGVSAYLGAMRRGPRLFWVVAMFLIAAGTIATGADPFVESLVETGTRLHINEALLIQWLAPLASEAPEFIIALTLAGRGKAAAAVLMLLTSMVNQWTCLVGSLPFAFKLGHGAGLALPLDGRQVEEFFLTASVTAVALALLLRLRIPALGAWFMLAVFVAEFALPTEHARLILALVNAAAAAGLTLFGIRHLWPLLKAPFVQAKPAEAD
jgi:cation:H+ antiporter